MIDESNIVHTFFDKSFEDGITEAMLEFDYRFPKEKMEDYVISVISTPFQQFVDYVHEYLCLKPINSAGVPQISNYNISTIGTCKVMHDLHDPGLSVLDIGRYLYSECRKPSTHDIMNVASEAIIGFQKEHGRDIEQEEPYLCIDGEYRKKGAIVKFAENQVKGASFASLTYQYEDKWLLTCLGRTYLDLDDEMRDYLSARTLLRNSLFWKVTSEAVERDVDIKPFVERGCHGTTIGRRLSSAQHFFDIIVRQCQIEGVPLHRIYYENE